jgi:hypothetical protein
MFFCMFFCKVLLPPCRDTQCYTSASKQTGMHSARGVAGSVGVSVIVCGCTVLLSLISHMLRCSTGF